MEDYAVHLAPRGGAVDLVIDSLHEERKAVLCTRQRYASSKGAVGLHMTEACVYGLVFKDAAAVPEHWRAAQTISTGVVACPKAKDRTALARAAAKALRAELAALPAMPDASVFTDRIGAGPAVSVGEEGRFRMLFCWYQRIGDLTFVMSPWTTAADEAGENVEAAPPTRKTRIAFLPEGCERVPLSRYYAALEAQEKKGGAS